MLSRLGQARAIRAAGLATIAAVATILAPFPSAVIAAALAPPHVRTLTAATASFPDSLDPQLSYTQEGGTALYDTYIPLLTYRHADGRAGTKLIPGLARALPRIGNAGRTYTLFLRRGLRYSNGLPVRASDFRRTIERLFELGSGGSSFYTDIVGARRFARTRRGGIRGIVTDNRSGRIAIHLVRRRATFSNELAMVFASPVPPGTPARDLTLDPPPATGPYVISSSSFGRGWSYARNPEWRSNNAKLMPQLPGGHVDRIDVRVLGGRARATRGVERGRFDWSMTPPPADLYQRVRRRYEGTQFRAEPGLNTYFFWMNTQTPPFDDLRVRRAVEHAVDPAVLKAIYADQISSTQQLLPPEMPGYRRFVLYPHDITVARRLIAEADPLDRDVTVWTDSEPENVGASVYYGAVLRELGFHTRLRIVPSDDYFAVIGNASTPNLDTGWGDWFEDYPHPNDFFEPLASGHAIRRVGSENFARIDVPALNREIAALDRRPGPIPEARYAALDRRFMERAPWVPYGNLSRGLLVSKAIDLGKVIWNPTFGADLTSFRFR